MSDKYKILKELIGEWIDRELENWAEAKQIAGPNCAGACLAQGAIDAYRQVLHDIADLERVAVVSD